MKKIDLVAAGILLVTLLFSGCSKDTPKNTEVQSTTETIRSFDLEFAHKLGEQAIAKYLGQSVEDDYNSVLSGVTPLVNDTIAIPLSEEANYTFEGRLSTAVSLPQTMPESKYYVQPAPGDEKPVVVDKTSKIEKFKDAIYPDGSVPEIEVMTESGEATPEFTRWFLTQAQNVGLLDKRIKLSAENTLYVDGLDCSQSKGGNKFNVFGTEMTVDGVVTTEDTSTSPTYRMTLVSYRYFDTGEYQALYETAPSENAPTTVSIEVKFFYDTSLVSTGELETYLAGVSGMYVNER